MTAIRVIVAIVAVALATCEARASPPSGSVPLPRARPALKSDSLAKSATHGAATKAEAPLMLAAPTRPVAAAGWFPSSGVMDAPNGMRNAPPSSSASIPLRSTLGAQPAAMPPARPAPALAMAASANTTPLDLGAVKQAFDLVRKGRPGEASSIEGTISDPLARKLVEWAILRSDDADLDFPRYAAFIAANPGWPSILALRRRAEAALWQQQTDWRTVVEFFKAEPPHSGRGRLALARALLAEGDRAGAEAALREAWRRDGFSADVEAQARETFAALITPYDEKARMDARFDVEDADAGMRAARLLGPLQLAIAKARVAVIDKSGKAKEALEEVPAEGRRDPGYLLSRVQWLRHADKIAEAAQWMLAAPREPERLGDLDQWWSERRLIARKLLDLGDAKAAYAIASNAAAPSSENYRADQQFTAGWIALRFLREPAAALGHFARIAEGPSVSTVTSESRTPS